MEVQFYGADVKRNKRPVAQLDIMRFFNMIKNPKPAMLKVFLELQTCDDKKRKRDLKEHLYFITPATLSDGTSRAYANIISFTGLLSLDFDKIDNALELKEYLFNNYPSVHACWLSSSGKGVRAVVRIPIVTSVDEYKSYFWGIANHELFGFEGFDTAPQNPVLPLFASYDKDLLIRDYEDCEVWTKTASRKDLFPEVERPPIVKYGTNPPGITDYVSKSIDKIIDNGHPQVRACAFTLGGWVSSGRISPDEAYRIIEARISANNYLSKGTKGYLTTAKEMIYRGMAKPLNN